MEFDTLTAARLQMTLSLAFHMVFAALGIGLPLLLVIVEGFWLRTGEPHYLALAKRWSKATGLLFVVGAVSGTALSLELGLLWPTYMKIMGAVVGHMFSLEAYAFFLEAIFIGLYLYGWERLSPKTHWWCGVAIAFTGMLSGALVLGVNAWMQLPVGFTHENGVLTDVTDPIAIYKQPGWFHMGLHSTLACYISVAFAMAGIYAWAAWRSGMTPERRTAIQVSMAIGAATALMQPISGDSLAKFVFQTQPAKFAAIEAQFKTQPYAPLRIGGLPDEETETTPYAIEIPGGLSFLATHDPSAVVHGLEELPKEDWPNVGLVHMAFDVMVGCGSLLTLVALWYWFAEWRWPGVATPRWLLLVLVLCGPLGFLALEAGWVVTEAGRQPWVIHGVLRTRDAVTSAHSVPTMFWVFAVLYAVLAGTVCQILGQMQREAK